MIARGSLNDRLGNASRQAIAIWVSAVALLAVAGGVAHDVIVPPHTRPPSVDANGVGVPVHLYFQMTLYDPKSVDVISATPLEKIPGSYEWVQEVRYRVKDRGGMVHIVDEAFWMTNSSVLRNRVIQD